MKKRGIFSAFGSSKVGEPTGPYEYPETQALVRLVDDAADLLRLKGDVALASFAVEGSNWRRGEQYIFVLDTEGKMLVHPDISLQGRQVLDLKDVNGKYIIRGLLDAATALPDMPEGWYHYQWIVPGGLLPRWKSSYVQLVRLTSGKHYVVGCGMYNDRMERAFVVDMVQRAVAFIEEEGKLALRRFYDPTGPFKVKDAYIFVTDMDGVELVNPAFPNLEGRKLLDRTDTQGRYVYREMIDMIREKREGWQDYMWPKPGHSMATLKSAYVHSAQLEGKEVMVGCGVYLADAPVDRASVPQPTAAELTRLVREAAALLHEQGEAAYDMFQSPRSKWYHDDTYLFVFDRKGKRIFHPAEPETVGRDDKDLKDILGRPIVKMILDVARTPLGEGWVHYMYPEPGALVPAWKSSFVKRVILPDGEERILGCGIYNMQMDKAFVEDVVHQASALIADRGTAAFNQLRDRKGPFVFMDTYVFVLRPDGTELLNAGMPALEGMNLIDVRDLQGKTVVRDEIAAAMSEGSAWLEFYWYIPGSNTPALKQTFVQKVYHEGEPYIVGSGLYGASGPAPHSAFRNIAWDTLDTELLSDKISRQVVHGDKSTVARLITKKGAEAARHYHENEEFSMVLSGKLKYIFDDRETVVRAGDMIHVPSNVPHTVQCMEDTIFLCFFTPVRTDWLRGEDLYLRR